MQSSNNIRIIGGKYKGLKLSILNKEGLRPTTDRARETLFNILSDFKELKVLDLFAGSGALGVEALSRGAKNVTLIEKDRDTFLNLKNHLYQLNDKNINIFQVDALEFLDNCKEKYDIIFLDPPYSSNLLDKSLKKLMEKNLIHQHTIVYAECNFNKNLIPIGYEIIKQETFGQIKFYLLKKSSFIF